MEIKLKRAYEPESAGDGYRVYVDRLWPRGLSHETFHYEREFGISDPPRKLNRQLEKVADSFGNITDI